MPLRTAAGPTTLSHSEKLKAAESAAPGDGGCAADGAGDGASASEAAGPGPLRPSAGPSPPPGLSCESSGKRSPAPVPTSCPRRTPSESLAATRAILAIGRGGPRSSSCACAALRPRAAGRRERKCSADPRAARGRAACCHPTWLSGSGSQVPGGGAGTGRRAGAGDRFAPLRPRGPGLSVGDGPGATASDTVIESVGQVQRPLAECLVRARRPWGAWPSSRGL